LPRAPVGVAAGGALDLQADNTVVSRRATRKKYDFRIRWYLETLQKFSSTSNVCSLDHFWRLEEIILLLKVIYSSFAMKAEKCTCQRLRTEEFSDYPI
jgi:hypothetical protein